MDHWRTYPDKALQGFRRGSKAGAGAEWDRVGGPSGSGGGGADQASPAMGSTWPLL